MKAIDNYTTIVREILMSLIVLMAGGTASGKTSIARAFTEKYGGLLINHDRYYLDTNFSDQSNFDEPAALENKLLAEHLRLLKSGRSAPLPIYDFPTHRRLKEVDIVQPQKVIIVEGILTLSSEELRAVGDTTIFVDAPADTRLARRLLRDVVERGRSVHGVLEQYMETVRPMHHLHVESSRHFAEVELDGVIPIAESMNKLHQHIFGFLNSSNR
jgi:uridine kinase